MKKTLLTVVALAICTMGVNLQVNAANNEGELPARQMEYLNRGLVAVKVTNGVFLSWRSLGTDASATYFKLYRGATLIKTGTTTDATNYLDASGTASSQYKVEAYVGDELKDASAAVTPWAQQSQPYLTIQLNRPAGGTTPPNVQYDGKSDASIVEQPDGEAYTYAPNDCSVGDLDGDGEYEIVVKWDPSNSKDNSQTGITGNVIMDAYKLDGTQLWRIDLGRNIRAGAHYTQFMVYDFDGDGIAEMVCKTAPGTVDGKGNNVIMGSDDPAADYRNLSISAKGNSRTGFVQKGTEYLTLFDGKTGAELSTVAYNPPRGTISTWGDSYSNRVDRFLACVAYLDGVHPSVVMCRGYYARSTMAAYDIKDKKLVQRWLYDSGSSSSSTNIYGQGNHNLSVADVDGDGKDEIIYGASAINDDGKFMYRTGLGHGDAMHLSDLDPDRPGLEVWEVHEETGAGKYNHELHDAATGAIIWHSEGYNSDNGRGMSGDIDKNHRGFEMWSSSEAGTYNCKGVQISTKKPSTNFRIYWDDDLQDELMDGNAITKWNGNGTTSLISFSGVSSVNGTKKNPCVSADILGDWREEVVLYNTSNPSQLRLFTTTTASTYRLYTLMHDPVYRLGIAWQNAAYNQPPHLGFYMGDGLDDVPVPNIYTPIYSPETGIVAGTTASQTPTVYVDAEGTIRVVSPTATIQSLSIYSIDGALLHQASNVNGNEYAYSAAKTSKVLILKVVTTQGVKSLKAVIK
ncbi:rhamnogalacturonan lyase [Viscerimonas tarda]